MKQAKRHEWNDTRGEEGREGRKCRKDGDGMSGWMGFDSREKRIEKRGTSRRREPLWASRHILFDASDASDTMSPFYLPQAFGSSVP